MRVNAIHHTIALVRAPKSGVQHINHQVASSDDVMRSYYLLSEKQVPIVFGPGRHPTSGARFLYFKGPDGVVFEYSVGVDEIADEASHRPRQFGFEPTSFCMWGAKPAGMALPNTAKYRAMDFGLRGRTAIVCAASKGLGKACAMSLAREGVEVFIAARTASDLEATAAEIRAATGAKVTAVPGDITTDAGRAAVLAACPNPDILVNNAGGPPRGDFRDWDRDDWIKAVDANMLTPIYLIKADVDGMIARKFGRIVNITSASVKSPIRHLGLSNGARAA